MRPPSVHTVMKTYDGVKSQVADNECDATIDNPFMVVTLAWKCALMGFGLFKAVSTWNVATSAAGTSDSKQFAVALGIGILSYLLSIFLNLSPQENVMLHGVCNFICSTVSVCLILLPKLVEEKKEVNLDAEVAKKMEKARRDTFGKKLSRVLDATKQSIMGKEDSDKKAKIRSKMKLLPAGIPTKSTKK